jgi:hypothetical protein
LGWLICGTKVLKELWFFKLLNAVCKSPKTNFMAAYPEIPPSALATLASISALRGAFSASTKLFANELTSTPEPALKVLIILPAAALAEVAVLAVDAAVEVVDEVAVTMVYFTAIYLM